MSSIADHMKLFRKKVNKKNATGSVLGYVSSYYSSWLIKFFQIISILIIHAPKVIAYIRLLNHECIKWQVRQISNTHNFAENYNPFFKISLLSKLIVRETIIWHFLTIKLVHQWKSIEFWLDGKTCALHQPDNLDIICWLKTEVKRHQTVVFLQSEPWGCGFCSSY